MCVALVGQSQRLSLANCFLTVSGVDAVNTRRNNVPALAGMVKSYCTGVNPATPLLVPATLG